MRGSLKRIVSALVFGAGLAFSLVGCAMAAGASFTIGANDTAGEVAAIVICFPGLFLVSVLAFWKRRIAGIGMLAIPLVFLS